MKNSFQKLIEALANEFDKYVQKNPEGRKEYERQLALKTTKAQETKEAPKTASLPAKKEQPKTCLDAVKTEAAPRVPTPIPETKDENKENTIAATQDNVAPAVASPDLELKAIKVGQAIGARTFIQQLADAAATTPSESCTTETFNLVLDEISNYLASLKLLEESVLITYTKEKGEFDATIKNCQDLIGSIRPNLSATLEVMSIAVNYEIEHEKTITPTGQLFAILMDTLLDLCWETIRANQSMSAEKLHDFAAIAIKEDIYRAITYIDKNQIGNDTEDYEDLTLEVLQYTLGGLIKNAKDTRDKIIIFRGTMLNTFAAAVNRLASPFAFLHSYGAKTQFDTLTPSSDIFMGEYIGKLETIFAEINNTRKATMNARIRSALPTPNAAS